MGPQRTAREIDSWLEELKQDCVRFLKEDCDLGRYFSDDLSLANSAVLIIEQLGGTGGAGEWERDATTETLLVVVRLQEERADKDGDSAIVTAIRLGELLEHMERLREYRVGILSLVGAQRGGRKPGANRERDNEMAREFRQRANGNQGKSLSALKASIGKRHGLSRSQSIQAINKALMYIQREKATDKPA